MSSRQSEERVYGFGFIAAGFFWPNNHQIGPDVFECVLLMIIYEKQNKVRMCI